MLDYIIAFIIFVGIVSILGFIFSFLWPLIVALIIIALIGNLIAYHKRKKAWKQWQEHMDYEQNSDDFFQNNQTNRNDEIIDVEFTETDVDENR